MPPCAARPPARLSSRLGIGLHICLWATGVLAANALQPGFLAPGHGIFPIRAALAQGVGQGTGADVGASRPTAAMIRRTCAADHARFCPIGQGGTRYDVACMQQFHLNLTLSCRNLLGRAAAPGSAGDLAASRRPGVTASASARP